MQNKGKIPLKVCGMRDEANIAQVARLSPDMMGFIFYEKSRRCALSLDAACLKALPEGIEKVGIFVDAVLEEVRKSAKKYAIKTLQLHGDESPEYCAKLKGEGFKIIKAFGVREESDLEKSRAYAESCDMLLFDAKCETRGGSGEKFDWRLLEDFRSPLPFLLSGGIGEKDAPELKKAAELENFAGVDINSRFEGENALKKPAQIKKFKKELTQ